MNASPRDGAVAVDTEDPPGPGSQLREARKSAKLSLEEVASELHLNVGTVRAIEENRFEGLPAPAFVRGYITSYARLLKLPAGPILEAYDHQGFGPPRIVADITQAPQAKSTDVPVRLVTYLITAGLLVMVVMWWQSRESDNTLPAGADEIAEAAASSEPPATAEPAAAPEPVAEAEREQSVADVVAATETLMAAEAPATETPPLGSTESPAEPETAAADGQVSQPAPAIQELIDTLVTAPEPADLPDPSVASEPADAALDPQVAAAETQEAAPIPVVAGPGENLLELSFGQDSWLEVYDGSGDRLAYRLASQGERLVLSARPPIRLVLGYAEGTRISFDGGELNLSPFTKRGMARVLISGDGSLAAAPREERDSADASAAPSVSDTPSTATAEAEVRPQD